jgi:hypothetical protein
VAEAFLGPPPTKYHEVNHKDGNRQNNCVDNLEWITHQGNAQHASETLQSLTGNRIKHCRGNKHYKALLNTNIVHDIRDQHKNKLLLPIDIHKLAATYGVSYATIYDVIIGRSWKHLL